MQEFKGLIYVRQGRVGSRSEGPDYYLQTPNGDYLLHHDNRPLWRPDYYLEFYVRRIVEVQGILQAPRLIEVKSIRDLNTAMLPPMRLGTTPRLGELVHLELGQRVQFAEGVAVVFVAVLEDSRAPPDTKAIWEGRAVIRLRIDPAGAASQECKVTLRAGHPDLAVVKIASYKVELRHVEPGRIASVSEPQPQYTAALVLTRTDSQDE